MFMKTDSTRNSVATPPELMEDIKKTFFITTDPCPLDSEKDCLVDDSCWGVCNYVNPPFNNIPPFIERALQLGVPAYFLIPYRANTAYWRNLVFPHARALYLFADKIKFVGYALGAPQPMVLVAFNTIHVPPVTELGGLMVFPVITNLN